MNFLTVYSQSTAKKNQENTKTTIEDISKQNSGLPSATNQD